MRTKVIFIFLALLSIANCNAQTFSVKDLIGTKWELVESCETNDKTIIEFTDRT